MNAEEVENEKITKRREYKRLFAEKKRREAGIPEREAGVFDPLEYQRKYQAEKRAKMTEEEHTAHLEERRKKWIDNNGAEKQREYVKANPRPPLTEEAKKKMLDRYYAKQEAKKEAKKKALEEK
jgi:hypothetical protein